MFGHSNQASPISKGITEIRINIHLASDKPHSMTHVSLKTPRVATVHDDYQRVESGPPYPSEGLPCDTSTGIHGCPPHYPSIHLLSMVGCRPTQQPSKLLSLRDSIYLICAST
jgi:hypothetical protein